MPPIRVVALTRLSGTNPEFLSRSRRKRCATPIRMTSTYRLHIRPNSRWLHFDFRALWEYRDLLLIMIRRDFIAKYKQTLLGPAWFVIQPLMMTFIFTVVFGKIARIPTAEAPPALFYMCGLLGWNYFATNFATTSSILTGNAQLFGKVYFPRLIPPLAAIVSNLFNVAVQLATIAVFYIYYKYFTSSVAMFGLRWQLALLPVVILQVAALSLGVGLWMSALTVTYRDFSHLSVFLMQLWMYATPVIYPLSQISPKWRWISLLNPMTMPVEATKYAFLGAGFVEGPFFVLSGIITLLLLLGGLMVFQHVERTFIDTV